MTDAIHKALTRQHPALKLSCCALIAPFRSPVVVMLTRAIQMAKACAVAGRPAILERITQWEGVVNTLKGAIAVATWDDPQVLLREMEGCRLPLANIVEPMLGSGNAEGAYDTLAEVFKNTPDGFLAMCPYPPGGEVDLLIVSDSSLALVPDPNAGKASCFSGGDLLKTWGDIRGIYTKMLWGKGLNHMVQYIPEAIDDIESTNRAHGRPVLPVLVIVGWAGNDVYGEGGYRGVHWIHRASYNKSAADREVTANWCERQRARVERSVNDLGQLKRDEPRILDIVVVGNADADIFALPSAYNETMRVHIRALREDHDIQTLDTTIMLARTVRYDKIHLEDDALNRKYITNFLQAVADCHLSYLKLISVDDHLRTLPRIEDLQEQKNYPNLTILKAAYQLEIDSNVSSPQDLPQRPDPEKIMQTSRFSTGCSKLRRTQQPLPTGRSSPGWETFLKKTRRWNPCIRTTLIRTTKLSKSRLSPWKTEFRQGDKASPKSMIKSGKMLPTRPRMKRRSSRAGTSSRMTNARRESWPVIQFMKKRRISTSTTSKQWLRWRLSKKRSSTTSRRDRPRQLTMMTTMTWPWSTRSLLCRPKSLMHGGTRSPWRLMNRATRWSRARHRQRHGRRRWPRAHHRQRRGRPRWSRAHHRRRPGELTPQQQRRREPRLLTRPASSSRRPNRRRRPCPKDWRLSMRDMARALSSSTRQNLPQRRIWCGLSRTTWQEFLCGRWTTEGLARFPMLCPTTSVATACFTGGLHQRFGGLICQWTSRRWWDISKEILRISEKKKSWWLCATRQCAASESRWTACRPESSGGRQWGSGPFRAIGPFSWSKGGCRPWSKRCSHSMRTLTRPRLTTHRFTPLSPRCRKARLCGTSSPEWCITPVTKLPSTPSSSLASSLAASHTKPAEPTTFSTPHRPGKRKWNSCKARGPGGQSPSRSTWSSWCKWATSSSRLMRPSSRQIGSRTSRWSTHMIWDPANSSTSTVPTSTTGKPIKRSWNRRRPSLIPMTSSSAAWTCWWRMLSWTLRASKNALSLASCSPFPPFPDEKTSRWRKAPPPGRVSRHHAGSQLVPGYTIAKMAAMTSTDACGFQRRGRNGPGGGNWNRGQGRLGFELQFKDISYNQIQDSPQVRCRHPICGYLMMDGHLKCPRCFRQMEPVTDANIATEVARREAMARSRGVPFSMDKVIFNHPRRGRVARQPEKGSSSSSTAVRTRSTYGNLRDMACNYVRSFKKRGFKDLVDRLVRDPFFQFNAANQNLVPEALLFIERLAGCLSPTIERTKAQVLGEKLEMATKLIFVPSSEREPDQPLDLHTEVFVSHRGVFLDIGQFAVYVAKFIKPKQRPLPIVYGWGNRDFVPDASDAKEIAKELVEFSKLQWSNYASQQTHKESETTGDDREVSLPHATGPISRPEHERPHNEQFEPNLGKPARGGPYGQGQGGKGHYKGGGQTKGKGQQKGKGKQGRSPPGGVAYGDFEGDSYWVQGYRYTWYWNQQRGWYWRWTWDSGWLALTPRSYLSFQVCLPGGMPVYDKLGRHRTHWTHQSFDAHYALSHSSELQCTNFRTVWMN